MKDNYTYPAILDYSDEGFINISFPAFDTDDSNAVTCVPIGEDFISAAQDLLAITIKDFEDSGETLPPEDGDIQVEDGQKVVYINLWMPYHRSTIKETYVKKTLTIPTWLDILAKQSNINFSATLVAGLKKELGLSSAVSDAEKQAICTGNPKE